MLSDVRVLAGDIGPRGTGSSGEEAAAHHVARRLEALALPFERHCFRAVSGQNDLALAICAVALLATALYPFGGALGRGIAALLALSAAPLLWHTIRNSSNPLRPFLPQVVSRNVLTRIEPSLPARKQAVLLAHLDTNRCRLVWQSTTLRALEPLTWLTLGMLAIPGLLYLAGTLWAGPRETWFEVDGFWLASLLPALYVVGMVVTLRKDDRAPFSPGAHDNAASVAVALELARRLASRPMKETQVWLAFTGAEESDHAGLYELLRRHGKRLREAAFIGLEGLGSGELVYLTRQGLCSHYRPDAGLLALAARVAAQRNELAAQPAEMTGEDETGTLRRRGYRAICIAGCDPVCGTLPFWHRAEDTPEKVSAEFMGRATDYLMALLEEIDREQGTGNSERRIENRE